jgi:beta-mannosidase
MPDLTLSAWRFRCVVPPPGREGPNREVLGEWRPASVPGVVQQDLIRDGLIADPRVGAGFLDHGLHGLAWEYETELPTVPAEEPCAVLFAGLDTVATIHLNDAEIGRADNLFRTWEFDLTGRLTGAENRLRVVFSCPVTEAERRRNESAHVSLPQHSHGVPKFHSPFLRKAAYSAGWDWLGSVSPAIGICRHVRLRRGDDVVLRDVHYEIGLAENLAEAVITAVAEIEARTPLTLSATLHVDGHELLPSHRVHLDVGRNLIRLRPVRIVRPRLWWPVGQGEPFLYCLDLALSRRQDDPNILQDRRHIGIRRVRLLQPADEEGRAFIVEINGRPVFAKGANWIPPDPYPTRVPPTRIEALIATLREGNGNLLRVWGGGVYENDHFYDCCDRLGVMVMQDFPFACNLYPEDDAFLTSVRAEAVDNLRRLRHHPCLVLLSGNNECHECRYCWEDKDHPLVGPRIWGEKIFAEILPKLCAELIPDVPYIPGSPFDPDDPTKPSSSNAGDRHAWQIGIGARPYQEMEQEMGRFISEFGILGMPPAATLRTALGDAPATLDSPGLAVRENTIIRMPRVKEICAEMFPVPDNLDAFCYASMLAQAEMMRFAVEHFRRRMFRCAGAVVWHYNDCWPSPSWGLLDAHDRPRALWFTLRRAFAPLLVSIEPLGRNRFRVWAVNDAPRPRSLHARLRRVENECEIRTFWESDVNLTANASVILGEAAAPKANWKKEWLVAELLEGDRMVARNLWFGCPPKDFSFPDPGLSVSLDAHPAGGFRVRLTAKALARDIYLRLDPDHAGDRWDDNFFTLLPGETCEIRVVPARSLSLAEARRALRVNHAGGQ